MSMKHDVQEAVELLQMVDDYGVRLSMGTEWCQRVDRLLAKYRAGQPQIGHGDDDDGDPA